MAPPTVYVRARFFGRYAELLGLDRASVTVAAPATVAQVVAALRTQLPQGECIPLQPLVAIDLVQVRGDWVVTDGDELAVLPPLAGG